MEVVMSTRGGPHAGACRGDAMHRFAIVVAVLAAAALIAVGMR